MFALGFFFKQATENGLLVGTFTGFVVVAAVALGTDIAWPWYCLIGATVNIVATLIASRAIDGKQTELSEYTVKGQKLKFAREGLDEKENGWYRVPGKVDRINYWLFAFFILTVVFLWSFQYMV
jgi:SSS family solute:Na+ symporter